MLVDLGVGVVFRRGWVQGVRRWQIEIIFGKVKVAPLAAAPEQEEEQQQEGDSDEGEEGG